MKTASELFDENIKLAYHLANKWAKKIPVEWEEIVQECMLALWKACLGFDPEKGVFSTYAGRTMDNQIRMLVERNTRFRAQPMDILDDVILGANTAPTPEEAAQEKEWRRRYPLLTRHVIDGLYHHEISQTLGVKRSMVGYHIACEKQRFCDDEIQGDKPRGDKHV